jgi:hypothetical protein
MLQRLVVAAGMGLGAVSVSLAQTRLYIETDCQCEYKAYARFSYDPSDQWIRPLNEGTPVDITPPRHCNIGRANH